MQSAIAPVHSIVSSDLASLDATTRAGEGAAIALYVHWPFCVSKCPYCDFNSHVRATVDEEAYAAALLTDLQFEAVATPGRTLRSIFFGGGTPSLMQPGTVDRIIAAASRHWLPADDLEITLEANPTSVEAGRFADLAAAGVNRLSLGLQALDDHALRFLGRPHDLSHGLSALEVAQRTFDHVSFDLIYARPGQTLIEWEHELRRAIAFGTEHLSLYQLTIEAGTKFATLVKRRDFVPADEDASAELFQLTQAITSECGLPAYEISNHARPGAESRHNLTYWTYGDYCGVGPGAHGRRSGLAVQRISQPGRWQRSVGENGDGIELSTRLTTAERAREALLMGLRLRSGIDSDLFEQRTGIALDAAVDCTEQQRLSTLGLIERDAAGIRVTADGRLVLNAVIERLSC